MDTRDRDLGLHALLLTGIVAAAAPWARADGPPPAKQPAATPAPAKAAAPAPVKAARANQPLDLRAPPVEHVMPQSQVQGMVTDNSAAQGEEVRVEQARYGDQPPVGFFQALPWGLMHPTQAWRLFTPVVQP
jgi:hypothetical protein